MKGNRVHCCRSRSDLSRHYRHAEEEHLISLSLQEYSDSSTNPVGPKLIPLV